MTGISHDPTRLQVHAALGGIVLGSLMGSVIPLVTAIVVVGTLAVCANGLDHDQAGEEGVPE